MDTSEMSNGKLGFQPFEPLSNNNCVDFYEETELGRYLGRPERWSLGSTLHFTSDQKSGKQQTLKTDVGAGKYKRLARLQRQVMSDHYRKRLVWEKHIGALSEFFSLPILDEAVTTLLTVPGNMPREDRQIVHLLGAIDIILRVKPWLITHQTLEGVNRALGTDITRGEITQARYQLYRKVPHLRPDNPQEETNRIMQKIAVQTILEYSLDPQEKKGAIKQTRLIAQQMLEARYYPNNPEIYGRALAVLVINRINKAKSKPRCCIPSPDPLLRKKISMAKMRIKKRCKLK